MNNQQFSTTEVWLPLRRYQLTLKHKLLNELGEISHFILIALYQAPLNLEDFEQITGMSEKQLLPILERLKGLSLIDFSGNKLTESGQSIAYILEHIHEKSIVLWLDVHDLRSKKLLMLKGDSISIDKFSELAIQIKPKWEEWNWNTQCFYQVERLKKDMENILPWLFEGFDKLPNKENLRWGLEWELNLRIDKDFSEGHGLPVELELNTQISKKSVISLFTEVLVLETHFDFPQGINLKSEFECPKSLKFQYSFVEEECYQELSCIEENDVDSSMTLECDSEKKEIAQEMLLLSNKNLTDNAVMFNRQHIFHRAWQQHDNDWLQVCEQLPKTDDIYQTYIQGNK